MNIIEILKKSDIVLIEGKNKSKKLLFSLYSCAQNEKIEKVLIISTIQKKILEKRINFIKNMNIPQLNIVLNNLNFFSLKENWIDIKNLYGFDPIFEDITRLILNSSADAIILYRPDLMFSLKEYDYAKLFLEKFIGIANNNGKKVFIISETNHFITTFLENYSDISLIIENFPNFIKIIIKHSLYPIDNNEYKFLLNKNQILLEKISKEKTNLFKKRKLILISKNERFIHINKYLFENYFEIKIASDLHQIINNLKQNPDIIIYHNEYDDLNFSLCKTIKEISPYSKIIFINNKEYIRIEDKMNALQIGCYEIFPKHFNLEEYILTIEKSTNDFFYLKKLKLLPLQKIAPSYENFCKNIQSLYKENIFFSVIETNNFNKEIIKKLRNHDILFINEKNNYLYLCLINVTKEMFDLRLKEKLQLENYHFIEVIEWDGKC